MGRKPKDVEVPSLEAIEAELGRVDYRSRYRSALWGTFFTLVVVAAAAILIATLWLPFLRIYSASMSPTLQDKDIVCCVKTADFEAGDMLAFYYNNKILVKRVIGLPGDQIRITEDGTVYVNDVPLDEPYVAEKALGECDLVMPFEVPAGKLFVIGDQRTSSIDSRHTVIGCIAQEQIVGKLWLRVWPLERIALLD